MTTFAVRSRSLRSAHLNTCLLKHILFFHSAFKDYKSERLPIEQYQSICSIVTDGFQEVSQQIQNVERQLKETYSRPDLADLIRKLQEKERQKLKLVRIHKFIVLSVLLLTLLPA